MREDVFWAIADPTRREILNLLTHRTLPVNAITCYFRVSRTAIYKHLIILTQCGLVTIKQKGRERYCEAKPEFLNQIIDWVEQNRARQPNEIN